MKRPERDGIFSISNDKDFEEKALEIFAFQSENNPVYSQYIDLLGIDRKKVDSLGKIPFLPIELFKTRPVVCQGRPVEKIFTSSSTTGKTPSSHRVTDLSLYRESFLKGFENFYGPVSDYIILALLPSYLEREGSSLIYMADHLIRLSGHLESGFYLNQYDLLAERLEEFSRKGTKVLLLGVSFALLDLVEKHSFRLSDKITVMETGGMKGRRQEISREELHRTLKTGFGIREIHSEYGMCEMLSQAYSKGDGIFYPQPWMKVLIRDVSDPLARVEPSAGRPSKGGIDVIDLANVYSCSFISTQDLGKLYPDGSFEVTGRFSNAEVRGCNLLIL